MLSALNLRLDPARPDLLQTRAFILIDPIELNAFILDWAETSGRYLARLIWLKQENLFWMDSIRENSFIFSLSLSLSLFSFFFC